ncbi:MAG: GNAT family N-acetyltransferase [Spirochaetales bacterium]|nr:GNAT family N-acetyltransferase [Spirochaetales bacterium]
MDGKIKIKIANNTHIPGIIDVWKENVDYHKQLDSFFVLRDDGDDRFIAYIKNQILSSKSFLLVGLHDDEVIGYGLAHIKMYPPIFQQTLYGYIADLAVKLDYMRNNTGDLLLAGMIKWFKSKHIERVELQVFTHNKMGNNFWKKHGFMEYKHVLKVEFCDDVPFDVLSPGDEA